MDHPSRVGICDRLTDQLEYAQKPGQIVGGPGSPSEKRSQRLTLDQLHREERAAVAGGSPLEDRHDARMLKLGADLGLFDEARLAWGSS